HAGFDAAGKLANVGAGAEGLIACTGEDDRADGGIELQLIESGLERIDESVIERIELLGSMEREDGDIVLHLLQERRHARVVPTVRGPGHPRARNSRLHGCRTENGAHCKNAGLGRIADLPRPQPRPHAGRSSAQAGHRRDHGRASTGPPGEGDGRIAPGARARRRPAQLAAVSYTDGVRLPMRNVEDRIPQGRVALRTNSIATVLEAVRLGWGAGDLPCFVGDATPELERAFPGEKPDSLDVW